MQYLNSGAGCLGGSYVNARHNERPGPRLQGWWSNREETRFEMREYCDRASAVDGFRLSNPPPLLTACVLASLVVRERERGGGCKERSKERVK